MTNGLEYAYEFWICQSATIKGAAGLKVFINKFLVTMMIMTIINLLCDLETDF